MFDQYISNTGGFEFPSFTVAIFSILLALVLSTSLAVTYRLTFRGENFPNNFFQAIVMSSTVSTMVMMAVGDNLAIGFGVLGAVSIIRFRTLLRNPRNIIFIFASLSVGIATGVFGYAIAISGTVIFCFTVTLLYFSPYGRASNITFQVMFATKEQEALEKFRQLVKSEGSKPVISRIRMMDDGEVRYTFLVGLSADTDRNTFYLMIHNIEGLSDVRLEYNDNVEDL